MKTGRRNPAALYNLGILLRANKVQESIETHKNSLKLKPDNPKLNITLPMPQDLLKQQQQQQQKQNKEDQNKDQEKDQENKMIRIRMIRSKTTIRKKQQQNQQQQTISKEDAERLLNAIANDEKNVQEKVKLAKAAKAKVRTLKNW
jgi:hypothetical protein